MKRLFIVMLCLILVGPIFPKEPISPKRLSLSFEAGNWQPHSLNDEPSFDTFGAAGATPYYSVAVSVPFVLGMGLRFSVGYWSLRDLERIDTVHSLTLHPITVDLKYWLIPDYRLSAYVLYGGGVYWGVENETQPFGEIFREARAGWGATLGAGFDVALTRWLGLGMAFQYNFVRFKKPLGGVDDFSGPKITVAAYVYP